jgi:hypothetical protein
MPPTPADVPRRRTRPSTFVLGHRLSWHAEARMREFKLTTTVVAETLSGYETRYDTNARGHDPATVYQLGDWAVITDRAGTVVITIVRRQIEDWKH